MIWLLSVLDELTRCSTPVCRARDRLAVRQVLEGRFL